MNASLVEPETSGQVDAEPGDPVVADTSVPARRGKRGERRLQILQALATMLEEPRAERVTTAALSSRLGVSEAALYRHFASKAQMYEGLIDFIERTLFGFINQIESEQEDGLQQTLSIVRLMLQFAERNPGMTRVLVGDALVTEDNRLQERINLLNDRLEAALRQCLKVAASQGRLAAGEEPALRASLLMALVLGRWLRYAKSGFRRLPTEGGEAALAAALG